jgi:peptide/nickel transport system ATP-binding protein/oligopeptide transport system ATP-binding protein
MYEKDVILDVKNLTVNFFTKYGNATAVRGISFDLGKGEKLGVVGESGSGKSVAVKSIIRLLQSPPAEITGSIIFDQKELLTLSEKAMTNYRGKNISMIFQEPMVSLNPLFTIGNQMIETIRRHNKKISKSMAHAEAINMLRLVEIQSPETRLRQYPFELSGGMQQRIMIAMALLCKPEILIADEPTTALDVTIQAQILDLLNSLNNELGTSIILITHDLGVIAEMVDNVAVMYAGQIVEKAPVREIFNSPLHPYTEGLLKSVPKINSEERLESIEGRVPSIYNLPTGCAFHTRCMYANQICAEQAPQESKIDGRTVTCWRYSGERSV